MGISLPFIHFIIQAFIGTKFDTWKGKSLRSSVYTTTMGRSQVKRNQAARGRGRGRGSGGRGDGSSSGGGGGRSNSRRRYKADPSKLGDNSFRYEKSSSLNKASDDGDGGDDYYDGLLDDINFIPSGLGEVYSDTQLYNEEEELADAILSSATAALTLSKKGNASNNSNSSQQYQNEVAEDWMKIDIKALDTCLKQIPIHERLKLPRHIGKHLEERYGVDGDGGKGRTKTLAELREESKCIIAESDEPLLDDASKKDEVEVGNDSAKVQLENTNNTEDGGADDEDEDLEAWLDDMIA